MRYLEATPRPEVRGRGALVLLHAFPLNARMWEPQFGLADRGWRVIAPQFRGFDGGDADPPAASVDDFAGDTIDLLDALHIHDAVVAGLSIGGYVAFAMLRHAPRYIRGLVLADTRPQADTPELAAGRMRMIQVALDHGAGAVAGEMLPKLLGETTRRDRPDVVEAVRAIALSNSGGAITGALRAMMTRPDSTPLLPSIHVPTLIVVGNEDVVTPPAIAEEMHKAVSGSELAVIAGAGHLSNLEHTTAFNDALAQFLEHRI